MHEKPNPWHALIIELEDVAEAAHRYAQASPTRAHESYHLGEMRACQQLLDLLRRAPTSAELRGFLVRAQGADGSAADWFGERYRDGMREVLERAQQRLSVAAA